MPPNLGIQSAWPRTRCRKTEQKRKGGEIKEKIFYKAWRTCLDLTSWIQTSFKSRSNTSMPPPPLPPPLLPLSALNNRIIHSPHSRLFPFLLPPGRQRHVTCYQSWEMLHWPAQSQGNEHASSLSAFIKPTHHHLQTRFPFLYYTAKFLSENIFPGDRSKNNSR